VRPGMEVFAVSAKSGAGLEQFVNFLGSRRGGRAARSVAPHLA